MSTSAESATMTAETTSTVGASMWSKGVTTGPATGWFWPPLGPAAYAIDTTNVGSEAGYSV